MLQKIAPIWLYRKERRVKGADSTGHGLGLAFVEAVERALGGTVAASKRDEGGAQIAVSHPLPSKIRERSSFTAMPGSTDTANARDDERLAQEEGAVTHCEVARDSLALLCGLQGLATMAIDLSRTHATNPLWSAHARFHIVWQTVNSAIMALVELALILTPDPFQEQRFYLAALLASVPQFGFFGALISRRRYGGALSDPNGIPPAKVKVFRRFWLVDLNVVAVLCGALALLAIIVIYML